MAVHEKRSFADELCAMRAVLEQAGVFASSLKELHEAEVRSAVSEVTEKLKKLKQQLSMNQQESSLPQQIVEVSQQESSLPQEMVEAEAPRQNKHMVLVGFSEDGHDGAKDGAMLLPHKSVQEQRSLVGSKGQPHGIHPMLAVLPQVEPGSPGIVHAISERMGRRPSADAYVFSGEIREIWADAKKDSVDLLKSRCCVRIVRHDDAGTASQKKHSDSERRSMNSLKVRATERFTEIVAFICLGISHVACGIMNPVGPFRFFWNSMCLIFILYDLFLVPMSAFKIEDVPELNAFEWVLAFFWTFDVYMSFRTGYIIGSRVEMRPWKIAVNYASTWLLVDTIIVIVEWINRFALAFASASFLRSSRALKIFRYLKLFRIGKIQNFWKTLQDQVNSNVTLLCITMTILGGILLLTIHIASCLWYVIGESRDDGWTSNDEYDEKENTETNTLFWYVASFRWVVAQFNGRTDLDESANMIERLFTCTVGIGLAVLAQAVFIAFITKLMLDLSEVVSEKTRRRRAVNDFLESNPLPAVLTSQIKRALHDYQDVAQDLQKEEQVLALLPGHLQIDILEEVRGGVIMQHSFFHALGFESPCVMRLVCCKVVQAISAGKDEVVFDKGDTCERMLFTDKLTALYGHPYDPNPSRTTSGLVDYNSEGFKRSLFPQGPSLQHSQSGVALLEHEQDRFPIKVHMGSWISEAALWVDWRNRGRLVSQTHGILLAVQASTLALTLKKHSDAFSLAWLHAQNVAWELNNQDTHDLSDILPFEVHLHSPLCVAITIFSAQGLRNTDSFVNGKSDPYCVCSVIGVTGKDGEMRFKTKVVDNCLDPVWNHSAEVILSWHQLIEFQIWDRDFGTRDTELGVARISPEEFARHGFEGEIFLRNAKGDLNQGSLNIKIQVLETQQPDPLHLFYKPKKKKVGQTVTRSFSTMSQTSLSGGRETT